MQERPEAMSLEYDYLFDFGPIDLFDPSSLASLVGSSLLEDIYLKVTHRNSIETWSATRISFDYLSGSADYDFTADSTKAFGNNLVRVQQNPPLYAIYSGDVNQDGTIDLTDGALVDNSSYNFVTGYVPADLNGDEIVDLSDASIVDNNAFNFVSKITP